MRFNIVLGNPPYYDNDGDKNLYDKFIEMGIDGIALQITSMIVPARWQNGGKGLDILRYKMLHRGHLVSMVNFEDASEVFGGVKIGGGVGYLLYSNEHNGLCHVDNGDRNLQEFDIVIRTGVGQSIIEKTDWRESSLYARVDSRNTFGIETTSFREMSNTPYGGCVKVTGGLDGRRVTKYTDPNKYKDVDAYGKYKVAMPKLLNNGWEIRKSVLRPFIVPPGEVYTESYLTLGAFDSEEEAVRYINYLKTDFVKFILFECVGSVNLTKQSFKYIPNQRFIGGDIDFGESTEEIDRKLYEKYKLTYEEIQFIKSELA